MESSKNGDISWYSNKETFYNTETIEVHKDNINVAKTIAIIIIIFRRLYANISLAAIFF